MRKFKNLKVSAVVGLILVFSTLLLASSPPSRSQGEKIWYVHDIIDPSLEEVRWREEGATDAAQSWIADGTWLEFSKRETLVSTDDIFVSMYERFNWSLVQSAYGLPFSSFDEFAQYLTSNPVWWIRDMWEIDVEWYGISLNNTKIDYLFDPDSSEAQLWTWYHVTRIPEYFMGSERLASWLIGFDLTPVSVGNLELYEFYEDSNQNGTHYNLYFKAPATMLFQHGENFTLTIAVSPQYIGEKFRMQQVIDINMPADTEVKEMSPLELSLPRGNTATFVASKDDRFPVQFTVISGLPTKPLNQVLWEGASVWLLTPGGWAAIATLTVLTFTGLRGRRIWSRRKMYHRMYNGMVTIYDLYSSDVIKFHQEMANISASIFRLLINDKITDEQFEKLLVRRDDLLNRAQGQQPRPPS